ncbi:collagen triple helix repeat (20 copies) [White spot syndrome virus]|uniref:Collagen triple helix repeat (20 copies) n=1 Tax=White spot syndrome virus TaxID=342409 RepID=A0A0X9KW90_9VIRU|nr:collagen triple helix repeat (20 copies) [White spot syndrome virus]BDX26967.1 MAG: structural protein VP55 [White spot syndrome virus]BDX27136.1 MAG: structural protein VP55 [White spot syndrome virus]
MGGEDSFDDRYDSDALWENEGAKSIQVKETDLEVYRMHRRAVPTLEEKNRTALRYYSDWSPVYRVPLFSLKDGSDPHERDFSLNVDPRRFGKVPVKVRRVDVRNPSRTAAIFVPTGPGLHVSSYTGDGMLVCPNHNFIGDLCSEIASDITIYNTSSSGRLSYATNFNSVEDNSPVGILFETLPDDKMFQQVSIFSATEPASNISIGPMSHVKIKLGYYDEENATAVGVIRYGGLFYTSVGACIIPEGVFFDDVVGNHSSMNIYNMTNQPKEIVLKEPRGEDAMEEDDGEEADYNFLGYVVRFEHDLKMQAMSSAYSSVSIDINSSSFHKCFLIKPKYNSILQPLVSSEVVLNDLSLNTRGREVEFHDRLPSGAQDNSYSIVKYMKIVSLKEGLKVVNPIINTELYKKKQALKVHVLNMTRDVVGLDTSEHSFGVIVCHAAKLPEVIGQ